MKTTRTFKNGDFEAEAYTFDNKVWKWVSNDHCCPISSCKDYSIPADIKEQIKAIDKQSGLFAIEYKKSEANRVISAEERYEMRTAFGKGTKVINVITGRTLTT